MHENNLNAKLIKLIIDKRRTGPIRYMHKKERATLFAEIGPRRVLPCLG